MSLSLQSNTLSSDCCQSDESRLEHSAAHGLVRHELNLGMCRYTGRKLESREGVSSHKSEMLWTTLRTKGYRTLVGLILFHSVEA